MRRRRGGGRAQATLVSVAAARDAPPALQTAAEYWKGRGADIPSDYESKVVRMARYCMQHKVDSVPDPYYGGPAGFEKVLDLLDDACTEFLKRIAR